MPSLDGTAPGVLGPVATVAGGLSFPSSLAFDDEGVAYVAETGLPIAGAKPGGSVWRIGPNGARTLLAKGLDHPVTGLVFHAGSLWISQGTDPGRISRLDLDGSLTTVLGNLPGGGEYDTNEVAFGPDGKMYWGQGTISNSGLVGQAAVNPGWLTMQPHSVDIPGYDIELADVAVTTKDPFSDDPDATLTTGPYAQIGRQHPSGTRLPGRTPATAAIHRANPDGSDIEVVAWGIRQPFGLRFLPDGRLLALDEGSKDRGSRPVGNVPDYLWEIRSGAWYGWPDFMGGIPVTDERFTPRTGAPPTFILANHDELPAPEKPLCTFAHASGATKFDVDPAGDGELLTVALFGDDAPGRRRTGRALALLRTSDWSQHIVETPGLHRPIDVRYHPVDGSLWILDFGHFEMKDTPDGIRIVADKNSGSLVRAHTKPALPRP